MAPNTKNRQLTVYTVEASGKSIGRLASEVASLVAGKRSPLFFPHQLPHVEVLIQNIEKCKIIDKKLDAKVKYTFTGYPGHLKMRKWRDLYERSPRGLFLEVVRRMLPANKMRRLLLKKIKFAS